MANGEMKSKIEAITSDEAFMKKLFALNTPEEAQALLKEKDIELSVDQVKSLGAILKMYADDKISDEDLDAMERGEIPAKVLEQVNGGTVAEWLTMAITCAAENAADGIAGLLCGFVKGSAKYVSQNLDLSGWF